MKFGIYLRYLTITAILISGTIYGNDRKFLARQEQCLSVEFNMYCGRPKPKYFICDKSQLENSINKIREVKMEQPEKEPNKRTKDKKRAYCSGVLVTLPKSEKDLPRKMLIWKGIIEPKKRNAKRLVDKNRELERYFVQLGAEKNDISTPDKPELLGKTVNKIIAEMDTQNK